MRKVLTLITVLLFFVTTLKAGEESKTWPASDKAKKFVTDNIIIGFFASPYGAGWTDLDTGRITVTLRADDRLSQPTIDETGSERTGIAARAASDAFFFTDDPGAGFRILADGIGRADQLTHGGLALHTRRGDELELAVQLGFDDPNSGSLWIALLHVTQRAGDFTHLAATAFVGIDNNHIAHRFTFRLNWIIQLFFITK